MTIDKMAFNSFEVFDLDEYSSPFLDLLLLCLRLSIHRLSMMASNIIRYLVVMVGAIPLVLSSKPVLQPTPPMGYNNVCFLSFHCDKKKICI